MTTPPLPKSTVRDRQPPPVTPADLRDLENDLHAAADCYLAERGREVMADPALTAALLLKFGGTSPDVLRSVHLCAQEALIAMLQRDGMIEHELLAILHAAAAMLETGHRLEYGGDAAGWVLQEAVR